MERKVTMNRRTIATKCLSVALSVGMVLTPVNIPQLTYVAYADSLSEEASYINLAQSDTVLWVGGENTWGNSSATVTEDGSKATIQVASFGSENNEWQLQYHIDDLALSDNTTYTVAFDITSSINKKVKIKFDDNGIIDDDLTLKAGETYHYSKTVACTSFSAKPYLFFAIGQMSGEAAGLAGTIEIENLSVTGPGGAVQPSVPDATGKEYDFSNTEDNAANDFADPGLAKEGYTLVWNDEFDGNYAQDANVDPNTGLNLDNWAPQLGDGTTDCGNPGWGNKELQAYTGNAKNIGVNEDLSGDDNGDGLLRITAAYEPTGYVYAGESPKKYTSARLRSTKPDAALFNTTYGYVEARISLPETKGAWPAFWMLPESNDIYGNWPVSGEIDIMETVGAGVGGKQACGTLHWGAPEHVYKGSGYVDLSSNFSYFHTYAVDWEPGQMTWYYDGQPINTLKNWQSKIPGASDALSFDAPFDEPFYMLLNLAVDSGQFGGNTNKATFEDAINMYVDYVRVYHKEGGYAPSATREASDGAKTDWADYAGENQIADITQDSIDLSSKDAMDDNAYDVSKWALSNQSDGTGATIDSYTDENGKTFAKVGISQAGANDYSVQLIGHYNAKEGYVYKVSFDAFADGGMVGKTVNCDSKEWKSWGTYGIQSFELTSEPSTTSFLFEQEEDFDKCRIEFNVGAQSTGHVYIGNVKVEIVDPLMLDQEAAIRKPLSDGNLIYNGTFDQGEHHVGYWKADPETTFEVPRYTTTALRDTDLSVMDVADGQLHYYERRAQISSEGTPTIWQPDLVMAKDTYSLTFDLYSAQDTDVNVGIYSASEDGLGEMLYSTCAPYKAGDGVKTYTWNFVTTEDIEDAALVFSFDRGSAVMLDNVSMLGASQATPIDETPVTADDVWQANTAGSTAAAVSLNKVNDTWVASGVTSDAGAWYTPQIGSNDFNVAGGKTYALSFKVKMDANTNGTFEYIVQMDGEPWTVVQDVVSVDISDLGEPDSDGFYTYTKQVSAAAPVDNVHVNFGLGHSQANNGTFSFKDVSFTLNTQPQGGDDNETSVVMPGSYSIFYELDGGVNADSNPAIFDYDAENSITLAAPTKEGFTFLGWTLRAQDTDYISSISTDRAAAITVYANWKENAKTDDPGLGSDTPKPGVDANKPGQKDKTPIVDDKKPAAEDKKPETPDKTPAAEAKTAVESIRLSGSSKQIAAGKKIKLTATVAPAAAEDRTLTWTSSNETYATVSQTGEVTTKKAGAGRSVIITAKANDGSGKEATYRISIMKAVKKITLKASKKSVKAGRSVKIKATVSPSKKTCKTLTWKSSNEKYATVSKNGVVKTKKAGKGHTVRITATAADGSGVKKSVKIRIQ